MKGLEGKYAELSISGGLLILFLLVVVWLVAFFLLRRQMRRKTLLIALTIFSITFLGATIGVLSNPLISGVDAPYYPYAVREFLQGRPLPEPYQPVAFYTAAAFSVLTNDLTLGTKIAQALFFPLMVLSAFILIHYLTKNDRISLIVTAVYALMSCALSAKVGILKNMAAMALMPLFYLFFIKFIRGEGKTLDFKVLRLNQNFILSIVLFGLLAASHFLTTGFVFITVVAHVMFQLGYHRTLPLRELKFLGILVLLILAGMTSASLREKVIGTTNAFAESQPVPDSLFPFTLTGVGVPGTAFLPFILVGFIGFFLVLARRDRSVYPLAVALLAGMVCAQPWVIDPEYSFRFGVLTMTVIVPLVAFGATIIAGRHRKLSMGLVGTLAAFAIGMFIGLGLIAGAVGPGFLSVEKWEFSAGLREQLPKNCVLVAGHSEYFFDFEYWDDLILGRNVEHLCSEDEAPLPLEEAAKRLIDKQYDFQQRCLLLIPIEVVENENLDKFGLENTGIQNSKTAVLELKSSIAALTDLGDEIPIDSAVLVALPELENEEWAYQSLRNREVELGSPIPWENLSDELEMRENERGKLCLYLTEAWRAENLDADNLGIEAVAANELYVVFRLENTQYWESAEWENLPIWPTHEEPRRLTAEVRVNPNPLFAFILLPIELSQVLYGTPAYGVVKLLVAVPLTVGLIGLLLRLCADGWTRFSRKTSGRKRKGKL